MMESSHGPVKTASDVPLKRGDHTLARELILIATLLCIKIDSNGSNPTRAQLRSSDSELITYKISIKNIHSLQGETTGRRRY